MSRYADIIERLEKADGPSRKLDRDIAKAEKWYPDDIQDVGFYIDPAKGCRGGEIYTPPAYTASLDAAIALVERMLPGWTTKHHTADSTPGQQRWHFYVARHPADRDGARSPHEFCGIGSPVIALLIALFRALEAKETPNDR